MNEIKSITNNIKKIECRYKIMCGIVCAKEFNDEKAAIDFMRGIIDNRACEINDKDKSISAFVVIQSSGQKKRIIKPNPIEFSYLWDDDFVPEALDEIL